MSESNLSPVLCTKVSDALGQALAVFHGTSARFDAFGQNERGIFFAETRACAEPYARIGRGPDPRIITAHLVVRNPWTMIRYADDFPFSRMMDQSITALRAKGYDAIHNAQDKVWIVFDAEQIKVRQVQPVQQPKAQDKNLAAWFGQSQVVDGSGQPLKVFHGTRYTDSHGEAILTFNVGRGDLGQGIYFASDPADAGGYANSWGDPGRGGMLIPAYLSLQNPYFWTKEDRHKDADAVNLQARLAGHDGIIRTWAQSEHRHFIVFQPFQIKSAIGNCGSFDARNDDIRFSLAPPEPPDDLNELDGDAGVGAGDVDDEIEPSFPAPC